MVLLLSLEYLASVALLAEGVDRNAIEKFTGTPLEVALLAEGVDRNFYRSLYLNFPCSRPPRGGRG